MGGTLFFKSSKKPSSDSLVNDCMSIRITEDLYNSFIRFEMFLSWQSSYLALTKSCFPCIVLHEVAVVVHSCNPCTREVEARRSEVQVILDHLVNLKSAWIT